MKGQRSLLGYAVPAALAPMLREERVAAEKARAARQQAAASSLGLPWPPNRNGIYRLVLVEGLLRPGEDLAQRPQFCRARAGVDAMFRIYGQNAAEWW